MFEKLRWKQLEQQFISNVAVRKSIVLDGTRTKIYYLTNLPDPTGPTGQTGPNSDTFIGIHGTGGTSLNFLSLIPHFPLGSRFYFIDLPGFGKSYTEYSHLGFHHYTRWIEQFLTAMRITQARFVAHSFGAYLTLEFARTHPERVQTLVLVSPAGLFPILGYNGMLWAILFKVFRFPYFIMYFRWIWRLLYRLGCFRHSVAYWLSCYGDRKSTMGKLVADSVTLTWNCGFWNRPALGWLLEIPAPITLVFGENDTLIPSHHGLVTKGLRPDIRVRIIRNASHNPIPKNGSSLVRWSLTSTADDGTSDRKKTASEVNLLLSTPERYTSSFSFHGTWKMIERLYTDLLTL